MKHLISSLLFAIIILIYLIVRDFDLIFIFLAWNAGYWKEYFGKKEDI